MDEFLNGKEWLLGYPTLADFKLYELAALLDGIDKKILSNLLNIKKLIDRIENIDSIKKYLDS